MKETEIQAPPGFSLGRLRINGWSDWTGILGWKQMNWIDMEILRVHFERAFYKHTFEINFAVLGFNLCIEWYMGEDEP